MLYELIVYSTVHYCLQAQINALSALLAKERQREAELELELARLKHANMLDDMLELQVTVQG